MGKEVQGIRNLNIFNRINKLTNSFMAIADRPFEPSYGSWYERVKTLVKGSPELVAKILELRPDMEEEKLSLCLTSIRQCLETLQEEDICREPPHSSTEEGYQDELAWFLAKLLEDREHLKRRGFFSAQGLERHFRETIFLDTYRRYEKYLYDYSAKDFLICPIANVTCSRRIELENWQLREITQEEFHSLAEANDRHGLRLETFPEFILRLHFSETDWQHDLWKLVTALRLVKKEKIYLKRVYHSFSLPIRPWEIMNAPEGTKFAGETPQISCSIEPSEEDQLKRIWTLLNSMDRTNYVMTALRRFNLAYERERIKDAWVDYFISLESLYTKSNETGEVMHRLSTRLAKALGGASYDVKREMRQRIKRWYGTRSGIVHGTEVRSRDLSQLDDLNETVRASIKWFINQQNWQDHDNILDSLDLMP